MSSRYRPARGLRRRDSRWADVVMSAFLVLAISAPTMAIEESWHGRPMIDQRTHLWIVAACVVALAFFVGGAVAAFRRPSAPVGYATAAAGVALTGLILGAVCRRFWMAHESLPTAVVRLWCFGAVAALAMSVVGSQVGRYLADRSP